MRFSPVYANNSAKCTIDNDSALFMQVVGELGYVEGTSANGVLYRVYTLPEVPLQTLPTP